MGGDDFLLSPQHVQQTNLLGRFYEEHAADSNKAKSLIRSNSNNYDTARFKTFKFLRKSRKLLKSHFSPESAAGQVEYDPKQFQNSKGEFDFRQVKSSYDKELIRSNI